MSCDSEMWNLRSSAVTDRGTGDSGPTLTETAMAATAAAPTQRALGSDHEVVRHQPIARSTNSPAPSASGIISGRW